MLSGEYEQEQAALEAAIAQEQAELDAFEADTAKVDQFLVMTKKYTDFSVLTTPMIYEFVDVDKILVHAPDRSSGERVQEVDIYLKFIGKFDVPLSDLRRRNWPGWKRCVSAGPRAVKNGVVRRRRKSSRNRKVHNYTKGRSVIAVRPFMSRSREDD